MTKNKVLVQAKEKRINNVTAILCLFLYKTHYILLDKIQFILGSSSWFTIHHRLLNAFQYVKVRVFHHVCLLRISTEVECEKFSALVEFK